MPNINATIQILSKDLKTLSPNKAAKKLISQIYVLGKAVGTTVEVIKKVTP